jgi:hypothetical protein
MLDDDEVIARSAHARLAAIGEPFLVSYYQSPAMAQTLCRIAGDGFDLIVIENSFMARFLGDLLAAIRGHAFIAERWLRPRPILSLCQEGYASAGSRQRGPSCLGSLTQRSTGKASIFAPG